MAIRIISTLEKSPSAFSAYGDANDDQLIRLIKLGDDKAFETIMNRHRGIVWRAVRQILGSFDDAEDVFQDVSISFYQNTQNYQEGAAKFSTWIYRVTTNRCLDILRSRKPMKKNDELTDVIPSMDISSEDHMQRDQLSSQLRTLLDVLPLQQKIALSLYYLEESNIPEISNHLSISEIAVRSLIKRGKEKLRVIGTDLAV
jgi:RNA polymerase sigma-70 factor (ECF subfamily)